MDKLITIYLISFTFDHPVEDNQTIKKTASSTRKTTPARKTTLQQDDQQHLQCGQDEMKKTFVNFDFKFGSCDNDGIKQDILMTPPNTVPPGSLRMLLRYKLHIPPKESKFPVNPKEGRNDFFFRQEWNHNMLLLRKSVPAKQRSCH